MKGISSRTVQGILLGWAITFEGFFALSLANQATIDGIGTIMSSTFQLAAIQLALLGIFISAVWAFKMVFPDLQKPTLIKLLNLLTYLAMGLVAAEGIAMAVLAGNVLITDFGGIGKKWIVLVGAQLFGIGIISLRMWRLSDVRPENWLTDSFGQIAAALIAVEGLVAFGIAGTTRVIGVTGFQESTIANGGLLLMMLGSFIFVLWTVSYDPWLAPKLPKLLNGWPIMVAMTVLGGLISAGCVAATFFVGPVAVDGVGSVIKIVVVAGVSQLFALGLVTPVLWKVRKQPLDRHYLSVLLVTMTLSLLAFEGVFAMALAANTYIEGLGGILERTFRSAGAQLLVLSIIALLAWMIKDSPLLTKWPNRIVSSTFLVATALIALEGLAVIVMAVNIRIDGFSGVGERYVVLGGLQMTLLAAIALVCWARSHEITERFKLASTAAAAFVVLLLPIALLL
ncbi:MAG: hypothetical protein AB9860_04130 [Methanomassiliicoccales archaeon]